MFQSDSHMPSLTGLLRRTTWGAMADGSIWKPTKSREEWQVEYENLLCMVHQGTWDKLADYIQKNGRGDDMLRWGGLKGSSWMDL